MSDKEGRPATAALGPLGNHAPGARALRADLGWPGVLAHPFNAIKDAEQKAAAGASPEQLVPGMTEGALATMGAGSPFARPAGSLGTFIGRRQADRLADAGRPAARQAIDYADMLEQTGTSPEDIRAAVHGGAQG
jgi:hypothetical protein